jgi:thymidylate synthase
VYIRAATLDDLLYRVFKSLLSTKGRKITSTRGANYERSGVLLTLTDPRARVSRSGRRSQLFSSLGELAWYLKGSKSLKFIEYYVPLYRGESPDAKTIPAAYGPRLFDFRGHNQVQTVIDLLKERQNSRRAVIQLFDASDIPSSYVPCTCTLQFLVRQKRLQLIVHMRSNDAYFGLPHDVFAFTMLQELVARDLGVEPGEYKHLVGSLHLYQNQVDGAQTYVDDGLQQSLSMPAMPMGPQWSAVKDVLHIESRIRRKKNVDLESLNLDPYWLDIVRLFRIFRFSKTGDRRGMERHLAKMYSHFFGQYIEFRMMHLDAQREIPSQQTLFNDQPSQIGER